jgi:surface polysaccharide O-acyltransferase-like enzyme
MRFLCAYHALELLLSKSIGIAGAPLMNRTLYYDILNIAACFSVVVLHCNQMVHTWQPGNNWLLGLGIEVLFYWAVPIFFMLTGATLMRYRERYDTKTFLMKRFKRTVIPFVSWSLILYLLVSVPIDGAHLGIRTFVNMMLSTEIESVYWFFLPLFSIYLSLPILSLLADNQKVIAYGTGLSFILQSVLPYLSNLFCVSWPGGISILAFSGMLVYVGLGYLLSNNDLCRHYRYVLYATALICMALRYSYTAISSASLGYVDRLFFSYSAFPAVIQGAAVFVLAKQINIGCISSKNAQRITRVSSCSFGVYLIHKPILDRLVIGDIGLGIDMKSIGLRLLGPILLYAVCVCLVAFGKKIPLIKDYLL